MSETAFKIGDVVIFTGDNDPHARFLSIWRVRGVQDSWVSLEHGGTRYSVNSELLRLIPGEDVSLAFDRYIQAETDIQVMAVRALG